jgi:hypothetical protein
MRGEAVIYQTVIGHTTLIAGTREGLAQLVARFRYPCLRCGQRCCSVGTYFCPSCWRHAERAHAQPARLDEARV